MKAVVFLADGFEECEGLIVVDILRRAGVETIMASVMESLEVDSSRHIKITADVSAENLDLRGIDLIVLPGGRLGTENLKKSDIIRTACISFAEKKLIAAICAAPSILDELGLLNGKKVTCHPDFEKNIKNAIITGDSVTVDGNIITGRGLGASFLFAFELVRVLCGDDKVDLIKEAICFN